jgi:hypothetical protein
LHTCARENVHAHGRKNINTRAHKHAQTHTHTHINHASKAKSINRVMAFTALIKAAFAMYGDHSLRLSSAADRLQQQLNIGAVCVLPRQELRTHSGQWKVK